jgi:Cu(I)/Ag(I) efflux system protein CusF
MRATPLALACILAFAAAQAAAADDMAGMKGMTPAAAPAAKTGKGTGVITAVDPKAGTLTIQHGPIPAVGWPAMSMTFKASPTALLKGLKVGQKIGFDAKVKGMAADVTAVRPM